MNFRSAKSLQKICNLGPEGRQKAISDGGRRIGRGRSEAQELCRITSEDLTRLGTPLCETGAADLNAPSGASTADPVLL